MTGSELLSYIRTDILRDSSVPYLWSDANIYRLLSAAERYHAAKTYSIVDNTKTITTVIGEPTYALPAGTLAVLSARVSTSGRDMHDYTRKVIPSHLATATGTPSIFTTDEATGMIRLFSVPDAVYTINLRVARDPAADITSVSSPEIPARYHIDLAEYVAWHCLNNNDVDGQSIKAADRHEKNWNQRVSDAKRELYRLQLGANPHVISNWTGKRK